MRDWEGGWGRIYRGRKLGFWRDWTLFGFSRGRRFDFGRAGPGRGFRIGFNGRYGSFGLGLTVGMVTLCQVRIRDVADGLHDKHVSRSFCRKELHGEILLD